MDESHAALSAETTAFRIPMVHSPTSITKISRLPLYLAAVFVCLGATTLVASADSRAKALPPAEALAAFHLEPGLTIELVAAEPLVADPVAFAFDEHRRMYVVENRGYPDPIGESANAATPKLGRIALLEDSDGDGSYDHRADFATGLSYPNGILPWRGGVFVTCSPDIYYLKDLDGDGVADLRQVVLTGFDATRTAQIRMSHPTLGLDGWVYVTSGLAGGNVVSPAHPERPAVSFSPADGRFHPDTFEFQTTGGRGQFGMTIDPFGRRFVTSNRHPLMHVVLEPWQLRRNPYLAFGDSVQNVSPVDAEAKVYPVSDAVVTAEFISTTMSATHVGTFTSACSALVFNGTGLSDSHQGNVFICEPAQNLVQRQIIEPHGVSFRSRPAYTDREFLASTDEWFRPVFLGHGPDGSLYLADMHRRVIDHPQYVPEESRGSLDFASGGRDGRIYRIRKTGGRAFGPISRMDSSAAELAIAVDSQEEWQRDTAHRLLLERKDTAAVPVLARMLAESSKSEARTRALWLLEAHGALTAEHVRIGLTDSVAGVREQAILLAGRVVAKEPAIIETVAAMAEDTNPRVRFSSALVLGSIEGGTVLKVLAGLAARDGADRWLRAAVLSGIGGRMPGFLQELRKQERRNPKAYAAVMQDLGRLFGTGASLPEARSLLIETLASDEEFLPRLAAILGLAEGMAGRAETETSASRQLLTLLGKQASSDEIGAVKSFFQEGASMAANEHTTTEVRVKAAALLGYSTYDDAGSQLAALLSPQNPAEVQITAIQSLSRLGDRRGAIVMVNAETWSRYTPRVREAVLATLTSSPAFINVLFDAIEERRIAAAEISAMRRNRLIKHADSAIRERAEVLFKDLDEGNRMQVYHDYRSILAKQYDPEIGREPFMRACSACHTYGGVGGQVGPDLSAVRNQPADALLLHILVPNYEVIPAYQSISVETRDGRSLSGWLVSETETSLTLRTAFGTEETVLRQNVATLTASGLSLMPDGLEQTMTRDEMGALISFLKNSSAN